MLTNALIHITRFHQIQQEQLQEEPLWGLVADFDPSLKELRQHEGGNDDDPQDPGGRTSRGIIQSEYDKYRDEIGKPRRDVWKADDSEVDAIYDQKYWKVLRCDDLPAGVDYAVFDYGVNSGVGRASRVLQKLLGVGVDGSIGTETIEAARKADPRDLVNRLCDERQAFLEGLKTFPRFGKGWTRRVKEVRAAALQLVDTAPKPPVGQKPAAGKGLLEILLELLASFFKPKPGADKKPPSPIERPTVPPWITEALKWFGFHEKGVNQGIEKLIALAKCGNLGDPWCAIFVNAMLESVGIRGSRWAAARSFESDANFIKLPGPAFGAIVTMWRESEASGKGHTGFYVGENEHGVLMLGGNMGDEVCRQYEPRARIVGYYWPRSAPMPVIGKIFVKDETGARVGGSEV